QAALETAILRIEAQSKFPQADLMYFTREAFEQASSFQVSVHRSKRYQQFEHMLDLGCSIGSDSLNMASIAPTTGFDLDPLRLAMARANAFALKRSRLQYVRADLTAKLPVIASGHVGLFFDPARRKEGARVFTTKEYSPPLDVLNAWLPAFPAIGVKISPGVDKTELTPYDAELEFVSLGGELKEAILWFGPLKTINNRATILPGPHSLLGDDKPEILEVAKPGGFFYEPDPAVIRAGLVAELGVQLNAWQLDPDIAYLSADEVKDTPFARIWQVEDWLPFNLKRLRQYLRSRGIGKIAVKKRASPLQPEELIRKLKLKGDGQRVVVLTHLAGSPIVIVCFPNQPGI
ncbi:MAG: class I SAM-dependent methyltransferase, partial [Anaerolineales bacterium]